MDHRPILQTTLMSIKGVKHVYFDPPTGTKMEYPCIRFSLAGRDSEYANDKKYIKGESYVITFITKDPVTATKVCDQLEELPYISFDRPYIADGLHHYVYRKSY
jgi:hypothetical protein